MKPTTISFFLYCLVLFFSSNLIRATYGAGAVFDMDGDELRRGQSYYAIAAGRGWQRLGGLAPETGRNHSCPFKIVQSFNRRSNGVPVSFLPVDPDDILIQSNTDLNIKFEDFPSSVPCPESNVWMVDLGAPATLVTTGGVEGNPGPNTLKNWFKIQEYEDAYIIQYCPSSSLCGGAGAPCQDTLVCENIGISLMNGRKRLSLSKNPLKVVFQRLKRCAELVATN